MVIVKITSGLGNQMFQYAFGFALAKRKNTELLLDLSFYAEEETFTTPRSYELNQLNILFNKEGKKPFLAKTPKIGHRIAPFLNYFQGYFQDEKYFADCKEDIRKEFQFKEKVPVPDGANTIAIHIRRGDYAKAFAKTHLICTPFYYRKAVDYIQSKVENPTFYVFSEDLDWVKQNINIPSRSVFIDYNPSLPSSHDMQLMSLCKHNIISNSSYSWWAAWLNQNPSKIIIAPDKWFPSKMETDIYTDNMIRLSTMEEIK